MWGETFNVLDSIVSSSISTHSPRVGRDPWKAKKEGNMTISTHSPRVGRDIVVNDVLQLGDISTHSPRVGRDTLTTG